MKNKISWSVKRFQINTKTIFVDMGLEEGKEANDDVNEEELIEYDKQWTIYSYVTEGSNEDKNTTID